MNKIVILVLWIVFSNTAIAQHKLVAGTYKVSSFKMDNNTTFNKANSDSVLKAAIDLALSEALKNAGLPLTYEDTLQIINSKKKFFEGIMSLTIQLKADGKFIKTMKYSFSNKAEVIESGTYKYSAKNGEINFISKTPNQDAAKQVVKYDIKTKQINFIAGPNEADAGDIIVQFTKTK